MFRYASVMPSLFLYWELDVIPSWSWSWWLKEQETTSALSLRRLMGHNRNKKHTLKEKIASRRRL